jgi:regulator of protease activity HflC (stomatin/prohibitin superfamily)
MGLVLVLLVLGAVLVGVSVRVTQEFERAVVFRLGRMQGVRGPGLIWLVPFVEKAVIVDLRTITLDVTPQDAITKDNVTVKISAVVYFRVEQPEQAILQVENYLLATSNLSQTTLRSVLGQVELDELLSNRDAINHKIAEILVKTTANWGVKVSHVEVKQIDLPLEMQRAMAKQAEAERERRAKVIAAEGELQASQKLSEAARVMDLSPSTLQLRYLQTLREITSEKGSHTIIPLPLDVIRGVLSAVKGG